MEKNPNDDPVYLEAEPLGDHGFFPDAFEKEGGGSVTSKQAKEFFHEQLGGPADKAPAGGSGGGGAPEPPEPEPEPELVPDQWPTDPTPPDEQIVPAGGAPAPEGSGEVTDVGGPPLEPEPLPEPDLGPLPLDPPPDEPPQTLSE